MWHENDNGGASFYIAGDIGIHVDPINGQWQWFIGNLGDVSMSGKADTMGQAQIDALEALVHWLNKTEAEARSELHELTAQTPLYRLKGVSVYEDEQGNLVTIEGTIVAAAPE